MDKFKNDLIILFQKNDENKHSYEVLLMFCEFNNNYISNNDNLYNIDLIKGLYKQFNFGGVQRDSDFNIEHTNFIESFFTLVEIINKFYSLSVSNKINIIEENIYTITDNTEKPFKTGLMDFLNYINLYNYIFNNNFQSDIDIIIKNKKFFVILLQYDKDIETQYPECISEFRQSMKLYTQSARSMLWMIQEVIANHTQHSKCAMDMLTNLFRLYIADFKPELKRVLIKMFTINIDERYSRIFTVFIEEFFKQYPTIKIEDLNLDECLMKDSQLVNCPKNISFRICNETLKRFEIIDPLTLCAQ